MLTTSNQKKTMTITGRKALLVTAAWAAIVAMSAAAHAADTPLEYRIFSTSKTSTMERELNDGAAAGFRFGKVMGGKSANGGQEVIVAMMKAASASGQGNRKYKLLATTRTSTMQKELQRAADDGFAYVGQTVFETAFGGREVVVILELDLSKKAVHSSYMLLATTKTSTMEKELLEAGAQGYVLLGLTVGKTELGGDEIITILRRED